MTTASESITRTPVDSTTLASIGYSAERYVLEAEFRRGDVYQFFMVPAVVYEELLEADSKGRYFNLCIKNRYPFARRRR